MPQYKHKKSGELINVPNIRVMFTDVGKVELDRDNVYNLSEYEPYSMGGTYESVAIKPNFRDKSGR